MSSRVKSILLSGTALLLALLPCVGTSVAEEGALPRIILNFGKGREVRIVPRGDVLQASAEVSPSAPGPVSGTWSIAGPMGPGEDNVFYRDIGDFKDSDPGEIILLASPHLPTGETGSYAVRLSVTDVTGDQIVKVIKYFVGERPSRDLLGGKTEVPEVLASAVEPPVAAVTAATVLSWDAVPGSLAYQVELFDKAGDEQGIVVNPRVNACVMRLASPLNRPPLVGLMLPAYKTETTIGEISGDVRLRQGEAYFWRVVAMDRDGRELCESPLREFIFSEAP